MPFKLLSDADRTLGIAYQAADNKDAKSAKRIAYVIDHGKITHTYDVKDAGGHPAKVATDLGLAPKM